MSQAVVDILCWLWLALAVSLVLACVLTFAQFRWLGKVLFVAAGLFAFAFTVSIIAIQG